MIDDRELRKRIGARLGKIREESSVYQDKAAQGICSRTNLSNIETGKTVGSWRVLSGLAKRYQVSIDGLKHECSKDEQPAAPEPSRTRLQKRIAPAQPQTEPIVDYLTLSRYERWLLDGMRMLTQDERDEIMRQIRNRLAAH